MYVKAKKENVLFQGSVSEMVTYLRIEAG
jgi:hypothetical protein